MANLTPTWLVTSFLVLALLPTEIYTYKIISVAFISSKSHKITYEPLLDELAARGHDVTIVAPYVSGKNRSNIREIQTVEWKQDKMGNLFEKKLRGEAIANPLQMMEVFYETCSQTYDMPQVRQLLNEKFDLVLVSGVMNECTSGFVYKLNTSIIQITPVSTPAHVATVFGNPSPTSFVPHVMTSFDDHMSFWQRTANFLVDTIWDGFVFYYFEPRLAQLYREKLGDPNIPLHGEVMKNASLILSNSHLSLSKPRPFLPDIIEVGGMHCHPANPLPKELDDFLNSSGEHGFILFSMGSILKASDMPESYRQIFLRVFGRLKQKVLWKWETEHMDDLPPNVRLSKWLPQQDVLGHPKIKAFITHGGLGGATEAAFHGVPLIGIPMMGDQDTNVRKSEAAGLAVPLDFLTLTEETLSNALNLVLNDPKYSENARRLSEIFRDQPNKPLDRAVYWTEYVIRHGGATHLRSAARDLNFFAYHSIDVIATLVLILIIALFVVFAIIRCVLRLICCRSRNLRKSNAKANVNGAKKTN